MAARFGALVIVLAAIVVAALRRQLGSPFVRELQTADLARLRGNIPRRSRSAARCSKNL